MQVAKFDDFYFIRSSDDHSNVALATVDEWRQFIAGVKAGDFDAIPDSPSYPS